jgi:hypothetical protein
MKIINKTYRDVGSSEYPIQKTPISELQTATDLPYGSLIHIVKKIDEKNYESQKMTTDTFKQKIYDAVQNTLKTSYWDTHELKEDKTPSDKHDQGEDPNGDRPEGTSFSDLLSFLDDKDKLTTGNIKYVPEEVYDTDPNGFVDHLYYDFDLIKRYMVVKDGDIETDLSKLGERVDELDCYFATTMRFATTALDNNIEVVVTSDTLNHDLTENDTYCQMSIESGNKISNEWTCPASGNLVIYGWLDSSACLNNKATPSAFCVIEGNINEKWEIISVCPVTPAKSITYVGFNLMVKQGLVIRARTGFICGVKSSQFPNQQDGYDTLANSRANGFKCMIYLKEEDSKDKEEGTGTNDNT